VSDLIDNVQDYIGQSLFDEAGHKIGKIGAVFLDDATGQPQWVTVGTGFFGTNESFVPVAEAVAQEDGLAVPFSKDTVKDAPNVDVDSGRLSNEEEENLYRYYGLVYDDAVSAVPDRDLPEAPVADDAVPAVDGIPPTETDLPAEGESNIGRTDLVQRDADYDDSDATGLSAGPTNRRGTETGPKARLRRWTQTDGR
jgi:hypothetical protein